MSGGNRKDLPTRFSEHPVMVCLGIAAIFATLITFGIWSTGELRGDESGRELAVSPDEGSSIPLYEGVIGHLAGDISVALANDLAEDEIYQLRLHANSNRVLDDGDCLAAEGLLAACSVLWAVECNPGVQITREVEDDVAFIARNCGTSLSLHTVDDSNEDTAGWHYQHGIYRLNGYFVVTATGFSGGVRSAWLREIDPEVARQID